MSKKLTPTGWWMGAALGVNLLLAAIVLMAFGADERGTHAALRVTARISFLWFWAAYAGGALASLFGNVFLPLNRHGRDFGLAFAAALLVHLGLVSWLCWIGHAPVIGVFLFFGPVAAVTYFLALCSFRDLRSMRGWRLLNVIGMNFILYAFYKDFSHPFDGDILHALEYVPFLAMTIAAPLLRLAALSIRLRGSANPMQ